MYKRLMYSAILIAIILSIVAIPVLADTINITVTESEGISYDMLPLIYSIDNAGSGYGLDTRVRDSLDNDLPHMVADDKTLFVSDITGNSTSDFEYISDEEPLINMPVICGYDGEVYVLDDNSLEPKSNSVRIEFDGYIKNDVGGVVFNKEFALRLDVDEEENTLIGSVNIQEYYSLSYPIYNDGYIYAVTHDNWILKIDIAVPEVVNYLQTSLGTISCNMLIYSDDLYILGLDDENDPALSVVDLATFTEDRCNTIIDAESTQYACAVWNSGSIFAGTNAYIHKINPATHTVILSSPDPPSGLLSGWCYALTIGQDGYLYAADQTGEIDQVNMSNLEAVQTDVSTGASISYGAILLADNDYLYLAGKGTYAYRIYRVDISSWEFEDILALGDSYNISDMVMIGTELYCNGSYIAGEMLTKVDLASFTIDSHLAYPDLSQRIDASIATDGSTIWVEVGSTNFYAVDVSSFTTSEGYNLVPEQQYFCETAIDTGEHQIILTVDMSALEIELELDTVIVDTTEIIFNAEPTDYWIPDAETDLHIMSDAVPYMNYFIWQIDSGGGFTGSAEFQLADIVINDTLPDVSGTGNDGYFEWGENPVGITAGISGLRAQPLSSTSIRLNWIRDLTYPNSALFAKRDSYPTSPFDPGAQLIYSGMAQVYIHTGLQPGTTYYYRAWSVISTGVYSTSYTQDYATTFVGVPPSSDVIEPNFWFGTPVCDAYQNLPVISQLIVIVPESINMPVVTACVMLTIMLWILLTVAIRYASKSNVVMMLGAMVVLAVAIAARALPGFFVALEIPLGVFALYAWRRT